jgi:hypothetical protein
MDSSTVRVNHRDTRDKICFSLLLSLCHRLQSKSNVSWHKLSISRGEGRERKDEYSTVGGLEIETCITVSGPPLH